MNNQVWDLLIARLDSIEQTQKEQGEKINSIHGKINWMYGWAVGAGAIFTIVFEFIKQKLFKT